MDAVNAYNVSNNPTGKSKWKYENNDVIWIYENQIANDPINVFNDPNGNLKNK